MLPPLAITPPYQIWYSNIKQWIRSVEWAKLQRREKHLIADGERRIKIKYERQINSIGKCIKSRLESKDRSVKDILNQSEKNITVNIEKRIQKNLGDTLNHGVLMHVGEYWGCLVINAFYVGLMIGEPYKLTTLTVVGIKRELLLNLQQAITKLSENQSKEANRSIKFCVPIAIRLGYTSRSIVALVREQA
jgi:hypothetical protein